MWITPAAMCPTLRDKTYLQNNKILPWRLPCFPSLYSIHIDAFKNYIYSQQNSIRHIFNTTTIRVFKEISQQLPWRLQNTGQWHANMPFRMLLLPHFNFGQKTLDPITLGIASECIYTTFFWTPTSRTLCQLPEDVFIWTFCHCMKCSIYPAVIINRWGLQEWF